VAAGTTHIRTHVDVDTDAGLERLEGVLSTREALADAVTMQVVAFPQSGMLVRPGTVELLEAAARMGVEAIGGLDPSAVDRDPVRHLDVIFDIARRHGLELDIHLHEPGRLGAFAVELIAERTRALGMAGRVTISHAFCLGMVDEAYLGRLIELLVENRIAIMSLGSGVGAFPPLKRLHEAGVTLCTGSDGVRDTWAPYNSVDMLERAKLLGYRSGLRKDAEIEMLLHIATYGGARVMGQEPYGLRAGDRADLVVVPGDAPAEAVIERPPRTYVVKDGRLVAERGEYID
jgi:cytosine/adenosine deaminase-related metal-dependent hydrolase